MENPIVIEEYRSPIWKFLALFCGMITVIFLCSYLFVSDVFWKSIFRFIAFIGFAGVVLLILKIRERPKKMDVRLTAKYLGIRYFDDKEEVKEELYERETIKKIQRTNVSPAWDFLSNTEVYKHIISFTDTNKTLSVFVYSGQNIHLNEQDSSKFENFLIDHDIPVSS